MKKLLAALLLCGSLSAAQAQITKGLPFDGATINTSNIPPIPVSGLPACTSSNAGAVFQVNNALLPIVGSLIAGGGAVTLLVHCNPGTGFVGG
jgi:hypothetical protein